MNKIFLFIFFLLATSCQYFKRNAVVGPDYYQVHWDESVNLIKQQKLEEAEPVLKELYSSAQFAHPELAIKALFELGQISEKKGEWLLALSQFKECEIKKNYLQGFKAELELPARLAGLYATLGELQISELYAKKVESNLQIYRQQISLSEQKAWWAETLYRMGSFPVQSLSADNWQNFARRFHSTSQYLIQSMELSDSVWSERSFELAQMFFKKSFELLSTSPGDLEENSVLLGSQVRDRINLLQEIFEKIQLYRPLDLEKSRLVWLFYQSVSDNQKQAQDKLYKIKDSAPLSRQSEKRNALKRDGILVNPKSGGIDNNSNDPNL